jgi:thiol:disulfide interchange protein DsbD
MRWLSTLLMLLALAAPGPSRAAESPPVASDRVRATMISEAAAVAPGEPFRIGLHLRLAPGWHTYWRNPGDAGAPAEITLHLPEGATSSAIAWPAPTRMPEGPLVVFGFKNELLLPVTITPPHELAPGSSFTIRAEATWLACEKICVPEEGAFTLTLPVAPQAVVAPAQAERFAASELLLPRPSPFSITAGFSGAQGAMRIGGEAIGPGSVRAAEFFPHHEGVLGTAARPAVIRDGSVTLDLARGPVPLPARLDGVLVLTDGREGRAAFAVSVAPGAMPALGAAPGIGLWQAVLFAALGGLILNLMPCVFPILAMKAFSLARLSGGERAAVRAHALSYTAGVVLSFAAIGGLLIALRAGGSAAGWGFQFAEPAFVAAMAWLMLAVGLNLSGVYGFGRAVGAGQSLAGRGGHLGSFATGVLAVLVATPCTAPFMAVALGAALAMPAPAALAVFVALGLGLAAPYALLAAAPSLARHLPRPGAWMEFLRQALAFPMYGAAVWLVWVAAQQGGADAVLLVLAGGLLVALAAWLVGIGQAGQARWPAWAAIAPLLAAVALLPRLDATPPPVAEAGMATQAWSAGRVAALQASGRPVFVNVTAAWCISCKVNEQVALNRAAVQAEFARRDVAYLTADWTRGDPVIGALLRAHSREGVPLYLLYPPGGGPPRVLPQLLTEGIVLEALEAPRLAAHRTE